MWIPYIVLTLPSLVLIVVVLRLLRSVGRKPPTDPRQQHAHSHFEAFLDEYARKQKARERARRSE